MEQAFPCADVRLDLVVAVPEHGLPPRRVHHRAGFQIPVPHAFLRAGEREREALLALAERRFRLLAQGDVPDDQLYRTAMVVFEHRARHFDVGGRPVETGDLLFE